MILLLLAAVGAAALVLSAVTGSRAAATRAGLLTAVLSTPIRFATGLIMAQYSHRPN